MLWHFSKPCIENIQIDINMYQMADVVVCQVEVSEIEARVQVLDLLHTIVLQEQTFQLVQMPTKELQLSDSIHIATSLGESYCKKSL